MQRQLLTALTEAWTATPVRGGAVSWLILVLVDQSKVKKCFIADIKQVLVDNI